MGCPGDKILQVAEHWRMAGCSAGQSSLAAVPAGFCHIYAYVIYLLSLTPCTLNALLHHGIQEQSQKMHNIGQGSRFDSEYEKALTFDFAPECEKNDKKRRF